jgi:predicted negative regulator of RcsB-dependent stress response
LAKARRKKSKPTVKEMKFRNDPMVRLYDKTQDWLQESGRPFILVVGVIAGLVLLYTAGYYITSYRQSNAEKAFAAALAKYQAPVVDTPSPGQQGKYYTDAKLKWQESAEAFDKVAKDYSGYYGVIGKYYAGTAYLHFDKAKGQQLLQQTADKNDQPTSDLARLALAQNYVADGDDAHAIETYEKLLSSSFVPRQVVQLGLGREYEKSGDKQKAIDLYFAAAQSDRSSQAGSEAEKHLNSLAPDRIKDLPAPSLGEP